MNRLLGVIIFSGAIAAQGGSLPVAESGTFFLDNGVGKVNESVIRSGKNKSGQMEFIGYTSFDLSGALEAELQGAELTLNFTTKSFSGKPATLTVDYLGTVSAGDLNPTSGAAWTAAPAVKSVLSGPVSAGRITAAVVTLPDDALENRIVVFRFNNSEPGAQWDITAPTLTMGDGAVTAASASPEALTDVGELYRKMIPADKQLDPDWVESLTERGHPLDVAIRGSKAEDTLKYIGMPVGGIACGTLVIDGAGQLYAWDIFGAQPKGLINQDVKLPDGYVGFKNGLRKTIRIHDGANYMNPPTVEKFPPSVKSGFALKIKGGSEFTMDSKDWKSVEFEGQWPVGNVTYTDSKSPLKVQLAAYSPFIPLNVEDSKLPATVMSYTLVNESSKPVSIEFDGWLGLPGKNAQLHAESYDRATGFTLNIPKVGKRSGGSLGLAVVGNAKAFEKDGANGLRVSAKLAPGESKTIPFLITWRFSHNAYTKKFNNSAAVATYVVDNFDRLSTKTRLWADTWNDSTLPQWFLDRSMAPASTLQTANCQFAGDRFWGWEGIGAGMGTCTHVWGYAQAMARLFPSLERNLREVTDFGKKQLPDGSVPFRYNHNNIAIDGQCGTVLRSYREHLISVDDEFLKRNWPDIKRALNYLIEFDKNDDAFDGLLDGEQHNTLDAEWYGKVHVLCSLYLAALRAGEEMAIDVGDQPFENLCASTFAMGSKNIEKLFNGEYYVQLEDPNHLDAIGVGPGVYIDQVYGQFWANQVGLGRLYNKDHMQSALNSLWKYNYVTDIGEFRKVFKRGRFYAWEGDAGLLMSTWPNGGITEVRRQFWTYGYFNECMSGFEHQVAAHMIAERDPELLTKGLAIMRTVHDRYAPEKRNPYNEIEFSDFYARAMSSYGSFLAACGFEYNGPERMMAFDPILQPENFRAPFTAAEGWGTFSQTIGEKEMKAELRVKWGNVSLKTIKLNPRDLNVKTVSISVDGQELKAKLILLEDRSLVELDTPATINAGQTISVILR